MTCGNDEFLNLIFRKPQLCDAAAIIICFAFNSPKNLQHQRLRGWFSRFYKPAKALLVIAMRRNDAQEQKLFTLTVERGIIPERLHAYWITKSTYLWLIS